MRKERLSLLFVSDCFVTQQQLKNVRDDTMISMIGMVIGLLIATKSIKNAGVKKQK